MSNIKKRLKDAYDSVIFYANKTWTNDNYLYHKANQELYARYVKIQEAFAEEVTRPRTVRDSIPNSKLAQYSNYKYDESRELSYTPIGPDVTFHYPCQLKQMNASEPWMLPEVEQLFIWLTYSPNFNLNQYMDLEDFCHTDYDLARDCCNENEDFHIINPRRYEDFERTPGKPRFTKYDYLFELDSKMIVPPPVLNFNSFEDMTIKMKFDVDAIKNIWKTNRCEETAPNKKLQVYKSPFDNIFVDETSSSSQKFLHYPEYFNVDRNPYHFNELQEKASDFRNLQNLTDVLKKIKDTDVITTVNRNSKIPSSVVPMRSETECVVNTPTRRLYSDVVQGVASNNKPSTSKSHVILESSPPLAQTSSCKDIQFGSLQDEGTSSSSSYKYIPPKTRPSSPSTSWLDQLRGKQDSRMFLKHDDGRKIESSQTKTCGSSHTSSTQTKSFPTSSLFTESLSNSPISCYNSFASGGYQNCVQNTFGSNDYQTNDVQAAFSAFHTQNIQNVYPGNYYGNSPYQYPQGNLYCNNFSSSNYPSNPYSYPTTSFPNPLTTNAAAARSFVQQQQQQQQNQNALHYNSGQWIINQFRSPSVFNVTHFPPQPYFLLPSHFPKQRWVHYMRQPPSSQTYQLNVSSPPHTPPSNQSQTVQVPQMQQVPPQSVQQLQQNWSVIVQQTHQQQQQQQQQSNQTNQSVFKTTSTQHIVATNYNAFEGSSSSMHNLDSSTKQMLKNRKINSQVNLAFKKIRSKSPDVKSNSTASKRSSITSEGSCSGILSNNNNNSSNNGSLKISQQQQRIEKEVGLIVGGDLNKGNDAVDKDSSEGRKIFSNSSTAMIRDYDNEVHSLPVTATASEELERQALDEYESSNESFYKELERQAEEQYEDSENWFGPPNDLIFHGISFFGGLCANYYYFMMMMVCYIYHYI